MEHDRTAAVVGEAVEVALQVAQGEVGRGGAIGSEVATAPALHRADDQQHQRNFASKAEQPALAEPRQQAARHCLTTLGALLLVCLVFHAARLPANPATG